MPEAQLDRFAVRMEIGYPPLLEEARMLAEQTGDAPLDALVPVATRSELLGAIAAARSVYVEESVNRYVVAAGRNAVDQPFDHHHHPGQGPARPGPGRSRGV